MNIEEEIIIILSNEPNLKAKEIADRLVLKLKVEIDKTKINKILYGPLKSKLYVDKQYRWSIASNKPNVVNEEQKVQDTLLSKLSAYYLDCIAKDFEVGVWCYSSNKYGSPDYGQIFSLPQFSSNQNEEGFESEDVKKVVHKVRKDKNSLTLQLGFPINLRKVSTVNNSFYVVEPIFLLPLESDSIQYASEPRIKNDIPVLNSEAIKNLSGFEKNELFQEILMLNEELGLNNSIEDLPDFDELIYKLKELRPQWNWLQPPDLTNLSTSWLKHDTITGIHNAAAIFSTERSKYTVGLEKELKDLQSFDNSNIVNCSLGHWISRDFPSFVKDDLPLLEPLPLNEEQRSAVNLALQSPLTVITGPPGTGKSQVVTNIIVNAIYNGQTVLFSSKNHKAVDVVYERINGLASRQVMLRLGNTEMQSGLANYFSSLLSESVSIDDLNSLELHQKERKNLIAASNSLKEKENDFIRLVEETRELEELIEDRRNSYNVDKFNKIKSFTENDILEIHKTIQIITESFNFIDKSKQSFLIKIFWGFYNKSKYLSFDNIWKDRKNLFYSFDIEFPKEIISEKNKHLYLESFEHLKQIYDLSIKLKKHSENIEKLKTHNSSFEITRKSNEIEELVSDNSISLWESWLKTLPSRLTQENRKIIGEFSTLLSLLTKASTDKANPDKKTYARYYNLIPKVANILPCWAVTSLSVKGKVPFETGFFDLVIIDEASQCDISSALPLLYRAKRAVIIGDNKQLSHISMVSEKQDIQLLERYELDREHLIWSYVGNSLFGLAQSICEPSHLVTLKDHHRSHSDIINFSNKEFYDGKLRVATKYSLLKSIQKEPSVRWENIEGRVVSPKNGGAANEIEAIAVVKELKRVLEIGYKGSIGVVSPFRAQANMINELINSDTLLLEKLMNHNFLVDTVHKFQGDERDLMIFSPVISSGMQSGPKTFLSKTGNLFNVAITRARAALVVIGDFNQCSFSGISYMENFTKYISNLNEANSKSNLELQDLGHQYPEMSFDVPVSDWEKILYTSLFNAGIRTIPQYRVEQYSLDMALIIGNRKLDIEVDGEKYHRNWDGELLKRDKLRNKRLIELGWDVQRFWVYEIKNDLNGCIQRIHNWIEKTTQGDYIG